MSIYVDIEVTEKELASVRHRIDQQTAQLFSLTTCINEAKQIQKALELKIKSPAGYIAWLTSKRLSFIRFDIPDGFGRESIWWLVKVEATIATLVLYGGEDRGPYLPCMCCFDHDLINSPYRNDGNHSSSRLGFRPEWSEALVKGCAQLECNQVDVVMGLTHPQLAMKTTPLPLEFTSKVDYLAHRVLHPLYQ